MAVLSFIMEIPYLERPSLYWKVTRYTITPVPKKQPCRLYGCFFHPHNECIIWIHYEIYIDKDEQ